MKKNINLYLSIRKENEAIGSQQPLAKIIPKKLAKELINEVIDKNSELTVWANNENDFDE